MGETPGFNPDTDKHNIIAELARNPLRASDEVQKIMRTGDYQRANELLEKILRAQENGGRDEEPRQAMAA